MPKTKNNVKKLRVSKKMTPLRLDSRAPSVHEGTRARRKHFQSKTIQNALRHLDESVNDANELARRQSRLRDNFNFDNDGFEMGGDDYTEQYVNQSFNRHPKATKKAERFNELWNKESDLIKEWFSEAFALGIPDPKLSVPRLPDLPDCNCNKQSSNITVYMLHNACNIDVEYCKCRGLLKTLILMQVFPSSARSPKRGCHFALLDFLHLVKMNAYVSNHSFANILNQHLLILNEFNNELPPLTKNILNFSYQAYRKIVHHVEEMVSEKYKLKQHNCYACDNAENTAFFTMDGNFQLKRRKIISNNLAILGVPKSVDRLWGSKADVEAFSSEGNDQNKNDCLLEDLDSDFKAARKGNRSINDRFDENGVFALCCGRHGVPNTMYDIFGGEGRKYALASVAEVIKKVGSTPDVIGLMYDIICLSRKRIEEVFPQLNGRAIYAVSVFHAFAHVMSCQMKYHPRYVSGFGYTDGEGCERLWSYLNGFIPISRSMTKDNRRFLLTDAVGHFINMKMIEIPHQIFRKKQDRLKELKELEMKVTSDKYSDLSTSWAEMVTSMSESFSQKYLRTLSKKIEVEVRSDPETNYYINLAMYLDYEDKFYKELQTDITRRKKMAIESQLIDYEIKTRTKRKENVLNTEKLSKCSKEAHVVFAEVLKSLFYDYITMILLKELILKRPGTNGSAKAARIMRSVQSMTQIADKIKSALQDHVNLNLPDDFSYALLTVGKEVELLRKYYKAQKSDLSNDLLDFHQLSRIREEVQFLEMESVRFLTNLEKESELIVRAILELEQISHRTSIEDGQLSLLKIKHRRLQHIYKLAKASLKEDEDDEDDDEDGDDEVEVEADRNDDDNELMVSEIIDAGEEGDEEGEIEDLEEAEEMEEVVGEVVEEETCITSE